ncbi:MAG: hypothetical protein Q6373_005135 [Candidatus Sigynarchaeota archaeon]
MTASKVLGRADILLFAYQQKTGHVIDESGCTRVVVKEDTQRFGDCELVGIAAFFFELFA